MIFLSVIIPTRNRSSLLKKTLQSLLNQSYPKENFEVIIVDNGSTDDTQNVYSDFKAQLKNVHYLFLEKPGLHEGRHAGLKISSGEILVYADDDIVAFPTWLEGIAESFSNPKIGLVGGKNLPNYEMVSPEWIDEVWEYTEEGKYNIYFSLLDFGDAIKEINSSYVFGCNFSVKKDYLLKIKGFHPDGMPEDLLKYRGDGETFVASKLQKLGFITLYNPKASVYHWVPSSRMNLEYLKKRSFAEGISQSYSKTRERHLEGKTDNLFQILFAKVKNQIDFIFCTGTKKELLKAFKEGYEYHQKEIRKDKELFNWVIKDNYLGV